MKAEIKPSYDTNRQRLIDIIPLPAPLGMYIEPTRKCNFKCFYCMHSTRDDMVGAFRKASFTETDMPMEMFVNIAEQIFQLPQLPKRIAFSGLGEPLMNKALPQMIRLLRDRGFLGRIDILTNGTLLSKETVDLLVSSGVSRVQISVQGLDRETYRSVCGIGVNFEEFIKNIEYLFNNKGSSTVFIKIIDSLLRNERDKEDFFKTFGNMCDNIFIEHLVIMQKQMGDHNGRVDLTRNLNNELVAARKVCGIMFYFLQVNVDGETFPCSTPGLPNTFSMGSVKNKTLNEIWNDAPRNRLLTQNLTDGRLSIPECDQCSSCICIADPGEDLDELREEALKKISVSDCSEMSGTLHFQNQT